MNPLMIVTASLVVLLTGCSTSSVGRSPVILASLDVPSTHMLSLRARAAGVQIYECRIGGQEPKRAEWVFRAPEADLFNRAGEKIGRHYGGPTWESNDGSRVVGEVQARHDAPEPNAIPWLLLSAKSTSGSGVFERTRSIQRVDTVGGRAPTDGCSEAQVGTVARVDYKATYYSYEARP